MSVLEQASGVIACLAALASLVLFAWDTLLPLCQSTLPRMFVAVRAGLSKAHVWLRSCVQQAVLDKTNLAPSLTREGGMSEGYLNQQTGVYRWAGGAILEDWSRPPSWFIEPFVKADQTRIPEWLLTYYEQWMEGIGFYVLVQEATDRLNKEAVDVSWPARIALDRLVRQPGFQFYPKSQEYGFLPPKRADYMPKSKIQLIDAVKDAPTTYRQLMDKVLMAKQQAIADAVMAQGEVGMLFNGDPNKPLSAMTTAELSKLGSVQAGTAAGEENSWQEPWNKQRKLGEPISPVEYTPSSAQPLLSPAVSPRWSPLRPLAGVDSVSTAIKTPKNSSKAAWSSTKLRELQSNLATYDSEVAQLFIGLAQVLSKSMNRSITQEQLDFDVNFGSPINNNCRQLSITVREPIDCRVAITQTLRPNGNMTWEAEVWDMRGIPSPNAYKGKFNQAIGANAVRQPWPTDGILQPVADQTLPESADPPAPVNHKKRPRQVRI
jgi:hypothetical protein